ncbi:hypothetical protein V6D40_02065 [Corynebacterium sp. Q4381]|uniref:hypothetical protein n=1 Tax=Corynebacterium sp. Marseille-Q4381 TaxID=3121597 RepID=UPI002FE61F8D
MKFPTRTSSAAGAVAAVALAGALTACGDADTDSTAVEETVASASTSPETSSSAATPTTTSSATTSTAATTTTRSTTPAAPTSKTAEGAALVETVAEQFSTLAPASLFAQLDECSQAGIAGSYNCSGKEVGQFQFFDSESKAASTTQLLTELRSSRVVEDTGNRVVGWSVLANSAIITVVDNEAGQVMQQLISTDETDPRTRIYELGLADQVEEVSTPGGHTTSSGTTSPAATSSTSEAAEPAAETTQH